MKLPNLDPTGGDLRIASVLVEYDGPQIFIAQNTGKSLFIAMHALPDGQYDRWMFCRISSPRLKRYERGEESLRKIFENPEFSEPIIVSYLNGDLIGINQFPEYSEIYPLLPHQDSFLISNNENFDLEYLIDLSVSREEGLEILIDRSSSPLWEMDPKVVDYLSKRRTSVISAAQVTRRTVLDLAFSVGKGRTDYPIKNLGSVLNSTQNLFDSLTLSDDDAQGRGPIANRIKSETQLLAVASFPSSFGLRVESAAGDLTGDGRLKLALEKFVALIWSVNNSEQFELRVRAVPKRSQRHFKAFAKAVRGGKSDITIISASPDQISESRAYLSRHDVEWLDKKLSKIVDDVERDFYFEGRLTGFSLKRRFFVLSNDDIEYSGRIDKNIIQKIDDKRVNHLHRGRIIEKVIIGEATGEEVFSYELVDIEEVD